jgi:hypothetical protein
VSIATPARRSTARTITIPLKVYNRLKRIERAAVAWSKGAIAFQVYLQLERKLEDAVKGKKS